MQPDIGELFYRGLYALVAKANVASHIYEETCILEKEMEFEKPWLPARLSAIYKECGRTKHTQRQGN